MKRLLLLFLFSSWLCFAVSVSSTTATNRTATVGTSIRITITLNSTPWTRDQSGGEGTGTGLHGLDLKMRTVNTPSWAGGCNFHFDTPHWYGRWVFHRDDGSDPGPYVYGTQGSNSYCSAVAVSSSDDGTTAQFIADVNFKSPMVGTVYVWHGWSVDTDANASGDLYQGTLTVAAPNATPSASNVTPSGSGTTYYAGAWYSFGVTYTDPDGAATLSQENYVIRTGSNNANACFIQMWLSTSGTGGSVNLENDGATGYVDGGNFGTAKVVENTQCYLDIGGSSATWNSTSFTIVLRIKFKDAFKTGGLTKTTATYSSDTAGAGQWQTWATWPLSSNSVPSTVSVSGVPAHINYGVPVTVTATYRDSDGFSDLQQMHLLVRNAVVTGQSCYSYYLPSTDRFYLISGDGSTWLGPLTPGSGTLDNGWCRLNGSGTSAAAGSGTDRAVTFSMVLLPPMLTYGTLYPYIYAGDNAGTGSGWTSYGNMALHSGPKLIITNNR